MLATLASIAVLLTGFYFIFLGVLSLASPARGVRFLHGFATSAKLHYLELFVRLLIGGALLVHGPSLWLSSVFIGFGWLLLITTVGLLLIPWQWHARIAHQSVTRAVRYLPLIAVASLGIGGFIVFAWMRGGGLGG